MTLLRSATTVLEPADNYDLTTLEAVKAYFNTPIVTDDPNDARLQMLISLQSKVIADYCDRVFAIEKVSEIFYTNEFVTSVAEIDANAVKISVPLTRWPVLEIESVTRNGATDLFEGDDFVLDADSGVMRGKLLADELMVTYTAGYDLPNMAPGPLAMAVIDMVRQSYYYGSRDPMIRMLSDNAAGSISFFPPPGISGGGRSSGGGGGGSGGASKGSPLSVTATALVAPFRRPGMA
jgi:hypothetical protein